MNWATVASYTFSTCPATGNICLLRLIRPNFDYFFSPSLPIAGYSTCHFLWPPWTWRLSGFLRIKPSQCWPFRRILMKVTENKCWLVFYYHNSNTKTNSKVILHLILSLVPWVSSLSVFFYTSRAAFFLIFNLIIVWFLVSFRHIWYIDLVSCLVSFWYFLAISLYLDIVVLTEGAPALLRRWGGNGPIGWRANVSPWFRTPLFGSSFSIDDGFGTPIIPFWHGHRAR